MDEEPKTPENENNIPVEEPAPESTNEAPVEQTVAEPPQKAETAPAPAPEPAPAAALPGVPGQWPGAFGLYKFSKQAVKINLWTIVIIWLLNAIVGGGLEWKVKGGGDVGSLILGSLATAALTLTYLASIRGQKLSVGEAISKAVPYWLKTIGLTILVALSLVGSLLLLIIPFFFVFPRLTLVNYFLVDKNMGVIEAYKASWAVTKGNATKVWGIVGASVAMSLLVVTIIGIPFAIYFLVMYSAAFGLLYEMLQKSQPAASSVTPEAPATPATAL